MNNWYEEIKQRKFHGKQEGKWYIIGWYEDEKIAYDLAEIAWEGKRKECWHKYHPILALPTDGSWNLDIVDDYFNWNVTTPHWYLHNDGTWHKLIVKINKTELDGEYGYKEDAEKVLKNNQKKPDRMENYQEHLDNAPDPYFCK